MKFKKLRNMLYISILLVGFTNLQAGTLENYQNLKACEKQADLWQQVEASKYNELPKLSKLGLFQFLKMNFQKLTKKVALNSDVSPEGWKKFLHRRGAMAKVKIVPAKDQPYTGIFQGADCALLRLSLTYNPKGEKPVAPGLALKVLRDGVPSANISALYALDGQGKDYNFFKNSLSNIVPTGEDFGQKLMHKLFKKVTSYPEQLKVEDMAALDKHGESAENIVSPAQIFFVPNEKIQFESSEHEFRDDLLKVAVDSVVYRIYAMANIPSDFDYDDYSQEKAKEFLSQSQLIGEIITTSEFIASEFGDDGIFFRHEVHPKKDD